MEPASLLGNLRLSLCCPIQIQVQELRVWPHSGFWQLRDRKKCKCLDFAFEPPLPSQEATPSQCWISSESKPSSSVQARLKKNHSSGALALTPALGRQRQANLYEFRASLVYKASSRTARTITQRICLKKQNKTTTTTTKIILVPRKWTKVCFQC